MSLKFLDLANIDINNAQVLKENKLNTESIYNYLLVEAKLLFSDNYIVFTNSDGVTILDKEGWVNLTTTDDKYFRYLGIDNDVRKRAIFKINQEDAFTAEIINDVYSNVIRLDIIQEPEDDTYLLNHYLKKSNRLLLHEIYNDNSKRKELDPQGILERLGITGLDMELIRVCIKGEGAVNWVYMNVQIDTAGYIYPVINIRDYLQYSIDRTDKYNRFYIPVNILKNILSNQLPMTISVTKEDLLWTEQICPKCGFNLASNLHDEMCKIFNNRGEISEEAD